MPRSERQREARRGRIASLSGKSRRGLLQHVQNTEGLVGFLTLTYSGPPPTDDRETKRHLSALKRWLTSKGIGLVWKQEFGKRGRPHFHLMTTAILDEAEAAARWARIVGCEFTDHLVQSGAARDLASLEWYMAKRQCDDSNRVPEGYANMGRWWGYAGPGSSPVPLAVIEGPEATVAKVVRAVKAAQEAKIGKPKRPDNGVTSRSLYQAGGAAMARDAGRYAESLGLGLSKPITDAGEKESFPATTDAPDEGTK